ncbi:hydantoinase/oxoprolinase family protein [Salinicola avicenniae]|uniref:hydantoinase/oxoprolinase family protein n=1 Tax=Salinicola avicenniae TaxID=2916836 RepID=UPI00207377C7|nr:MULTISPECIES: hydantoinase/oxoprolinase family protein [unclassified Salinicola]
MAPSDMAQNDNNFRVGIDVGGTFTDFVLFDPSGRQAPIFHKEPSTPADPAQAVGNGLARLIAEQALPPSAIAAIQHGTTIGLNAIIQRRGARVGLIVSEGFRDILEIGRARMPSSFDFHATRETPLIPRENVLEIGARFDRDGAITRWPDAAEIERVAADLAALDVDAAVLMLINGYLQPEQETELAAALARHGSTISVLSAAQTWPEIREYERTMAAVLNAYIQPLMDRYFARLTELIGELGIDAPLLVTTSNGGSMSLATALARPIDTVLSGPASGVVAAIRLGNEADVSRLVTFDMGGTSSDIAVSQARAPEMVTRTEIGGMPLVVPVVGVSAIGAGGGSKVWVDELGVLKVGPESAGADPGPIAYGRGGTEPTVTDCYLTLGVLDAEVFAGGTMTLDTRDVSQALEAVAARLAMSGEDAGVRAAAGALEIATAQMAAELRKGLAQRGLDPADFTLVPFGGAGPTHANWLAAEAGLPRVMVPLQPGTFCALGAATADLRRDFVRSLRVTLDDEAAGEITNRWATMIDEARDWLADQGFESADGDDVQLLPALDMRYAGQAYELNVAFAADRLAELDAATLREAFHREHELHYGFRDEGFRDEGFGNDEGRDQPTPIEVSTIRLAVVGRLVDATSPSRFAGEGVTPRTHRRLFLHGEWHEAAIYARAELGANDRFAGPAIVEQDDTTVVILPGWHARVDALGNLHLAADADESFADEEPRA